LYEQVENRAYQQVVARGLQEPQKLFGHKWRDQDRVGLAR